MTLDRIAWFIGQSARPFAIIWTALCAGVAVVILALKLTDPAQAAIVIGAVYGAGLSPIYIGKSWEERGAAKSNANVEIAKAGVSTNMTVEAESVEVNQK